MTTQATAERGVITKALEWISRKVPSSPSRFWGWTFISVGGSTLVLGVAWRLLRGDAPLHDGRLQDPTFDVWILGVGATCVTMALAYCASCLAPSGRRWRYALAGALVFGICAALWEAWWIPLALFAFITF